MIKLLSFWLAWRAIRLIVATAVVIGAITLLVDRNAGAPRRGISPLTQLHHATRGLEQQLGRTIERALKP